MNYEKKYDWKPVEEDRSHDVVHKVKVEEHETGKEKQKWFNFEYKQTEGSRWKKHVDQWIEKLRSSDQDKPSVL